jgi:hypothetical protein
VSTPSTFGPLFLRKGGGETSGKSPGNKTVTGFLCAVADPVLKTHHRARPYRRHGWGPKEADAIIASDGCWYNRRPKEAPGWRASLIDLFAA